MINLQGYHFQGTTGGAGSSDSGPSTGNGPLIFASYYPGSVTTEPLQIEIGGRTCYMGYDNNYESPGMNSGQIASYYGPYYWTYGMTELEPATGWQIMASGYINEQGQQISGIPSTTHAAHCNFVYIIVGTPAPNASWVSSLPQGAFAANYNQGYAFNELYTLSSLATQFILTGSKKKSAPGGQYKFNGRYVSTGQGASSSTGTIVDIRNGLKKYRGYKSWTTGWVYVGDSAYWYLRDLAGGYKPSCYNKPFASYSVSGCTAAAGLNMYDFGTVVPSINAPYDTASTFNFDVIYETKIDEETHLPAYVDTGRSVIYSCTVPDTYFLNTPFQLKSTFPGYSYPQFGNRGMWLPGYACGYIFTTEAITL